MEKAKKKSILSEKQKKIINAVVIALELIIVVVAIGFSISILLSTGYETTTDFGDALTVEVYQRTVMPQKIPAARSCFHREMAPDEAIGIAFEPCCPYVVPLQVCEPVSAVAVRCGRDGDEAVGGYETEVAEKRVRTCAAVLMQQAFGFAICKGGLAGTLAHDLVAGDSGRNDVFALRVEEADEPVFALAYVYRQDALAERAQDSLDAASGELPQQVAPCVEDHECGVFRIVSVDGFFHVFPPNDQFAVCGVHYPVVHRWEHHVSRRVDDTTASVDGEKDGDAFMECADGLHGFSANYVKVFPYLPVAVDEHDRPAGKRGYCRR